MEGSISTLVSQNWWSATRKWIAGAPGIRPVPQTPRIGIALGGGFARGIAHIGVLRVLEKNNIPIHCISGISAGAMVAAAYAGGCNPDQIEKAAKSMRFRDVARWTISRLGFAGSDRMVTFLDRLLRQNRFENMRIPLAIVATDLASGEPVVFRDKGDVVAPIRASCAYPGLFLPIRHEGHCLVDGAISMEVPARPLRDLGATHIISVHLPSPSGCGDPGSMFSVVNRCFQVMSTRLEQEWRRCSNLVISPDVADAAWDSFESAGKMVELGEKAATAALPTIQQWLKPRPVALNVRVAG
ncbi:MAG TPA: patatin-like phospholipase family protein [Bryobacteraceae bacterium]|nr:patatin-like phospholipase family protein [Bryobacteraceae bacterium]